MGIFGNDILQNGCFWQVFLHNPKPDLVVVHLILNVLPGALNHDCHVDGGGGGGGYVLTVLGFTGIYTR